MMTTLGDESGFELSEPLEGSGTEEGAFRVGNPSSVVKRLSVKAHHERRTRATIHCPPATTVTAARIRIPGSASIRNRWLP